MWSTVAAIAAYAWLFAMVSVLTYLVWPPRRRCVVCELPVRRWSHRTVRLAGGRAHWACVHPSDERIRRMVERAR